MAPSELWSCRTDRTQADGQAVGGGQGVGVVLAEVAAAAGQGVLV